MTPAPNGMQSLLLAASDSELDASMKPLIEKWSSPPTALQVLEVLDACIFASLASNFVVMALTTLYEQCCADEGVRHEAVQKLATWRKKQP